MYPCINIMCNGRARKRNSLCTVCLRREMEQQAAFIDQKTERREAYQRRQHNHRPLPKDK